MSAGGIDSGCVGGLGTPSGSGVGKPLAPTAPLVITVHGTPAPQGSKLRTRFGLVDDNAKTLKPWRKAVTTAAVLSCDGYWSAIVTQQGALFTGPVCVEITFSLTRPGTHYRTGRFAHLLRDLAPGWPIARGNGDVDKYARAICDGLTDGHVWHDDVQVVELTARKVYVGTGIDALDRPGALIRVWSVAS